MSIPKGKHRLECKESFPAKRISLPVLSRHRSERIQQPFQSDDWSAKSRKPEWTLNLFCGWPAWRYSAAACDRPLTDETDQSQWACVLIEPTVLLQALSVAGLRYAFSSGWNLNKHSGPLLIWDLKSPSLKHSVSHGLAHRHGFELRPAHHGRVSGTLANRTPPLVGASWRCHQANRKRFRAGNLECSGGFDPAVGWHGSCRKFEGHSREYNNRLN